MRNKIIAFFCVIAMFIPTYIAIWAYFNAQNNPVDKSNVTGMQLVDLNGTVFEFDKKISNEDNLMIDFFMQLNDNAKPEPSGIPDPLINKNCFVITYLSHLNTSVYNYYFTKNPKEAFYTDNTGEAFNIREDDADQFLRSEYARCLYPGATEPVLTLADNSVVEPSKFTWRYLLDHLDSYITLPVINNINVPVQTHSLVGGALGLDFTVWPDSLHVSIVENGKEIFSDEYSRISTINLNENSTLTITLEGNWYDSEERGAGGEATYIFYADVKAQPSFYLEKTSVEPGDFVILTGLNVMNINDIKFSSEPEINFTPVFFVNDKDTRYVHALVPIAFDLPSIDESKDNDFTFTVSMYGVSHELTLNVKAKKFKLQDYNVSDETIRNRRTEATIEAFNNALTSTYSSKETKRYWDDDTFLQAREGGANSNIGTGFGIYRRLNTGEIYRHTGVDYLTGGNEKVLAVSSGKVIYVGEQILSGRIVVIDHGWGLKSTYCHMSIVNVKEQDIVNRGDVIGIVGTSGFIISGRGLHAGLSVFDVPVCPYPLWENPIPLNTK
ncbi:MAG: M23 family metallopeptidase [Oscillospiraceae bacterium]|nr:M23 family metallopeptidase [Oscillospiraceae bacterium]